jgi:hypothetical protein
MPRQGGQPARPFRRRGLNHRFLTAPAAVPRSADHADAQLGRDVIQHLSAVFADDMQWLAATRAGLVLDIDDDLVAWQMLGQRAAIAFRRLLRRRGFRGLLPQRRRDRVQFG